MKKIRESNLAKMEQLYKLYESKMYSVAYGILKNLVQSEDVVQDSFIKLANYLDRIKAVDDNTTKWLVMKIVKTTAINVYRRNQRESLLFEYSEDLEIEDPQNVIDTKIISMHNRAILYPIIINMPEIYKEVIKLHYFYELSLMEISGIIGVDNSTVRKRNERAKKYIIEMIGGYENEKESEKINAKLRQKDI